jgi:hypothetical protein
MLGLAAQATTPEVQDHFNDLAHRWATLAADLEFTASLLAHWGEPQQETLQS